MTLLKKLIVQTQQLIYDLNDNLHIIGFPLWIIWSMLHRIKFSLGKKIEDIKGRFKFLESKINVDKIYWVNPNLIQHYSKRENNEIDNKKIIKKGFWDQNKKIIETSPIYIVFSQRIKEKMNWEEIESKNKNLKQILYLKEKKNENNYNKMLNRLDTVINQVEKDGIQNIDNINKYKEYLSQINFSIFSGDIIVNIDRNGNFIVINNIAMFILLKLFNAPKIPVKIQTRHKKWINFKKEIWYFSRSGGLYQKPTHPDLQDFPYRYGDLRFKIIKENLSLSKGNLLDIGANLGYFSRKFEDLGFNCYAIEGNWLYAHFLIKLRNAEHKKFKLIRRTIFKLNKGKKLKYDVILALNIFHHFLKRKNTYLNLIEFLKRLQVKEFFFEAHNPKEFQASNIYCNLNPEEFVDFILKHSNLGHANFLATVKPGRNLYKLTP